MFQTSFNQIQADKVVINIYMRIKTGFDVVLTRFQQLLIYILLSNI